LLLSLLTDALLSSAIIACAALSVGYHYDEMLKHPKKIMISVVATILALSRPALLSSWESQNRIARAGQAVDCVSWRSEAKFSGYAYDHLVHLDNRCPHSAECAVKTDVNPTPQTVVLVTQEKKTILTFRGSPARSFQASVSCEKR
jgi:hypothetical protein